MRLWWGDLAAQVVSGRIGQAVENSAALLLLPRRFRPHGMMLVTLDTYSLWLFDSNSTDNANPNALAIPGEPVGRWILIAKG